MNLADRYERRAEIRQLILDYIIEHPGTNVATLAEVFNKSKSCVQNYLRAMRHAGEVTSEPRVIGKNVVPYYTAEVTEVTTPFEIDAVTTVVGNRTIHRGNDRARPIPNQRGQGAAPLPAGMRPFSGVE